ncbi:hypothetical protein BaRGS_00036807, partial [Batillaria attramentaria]
GAAGQGVSLAPKEAGENATDRKVSRGGVATKSAHRSRKQGSTARVQNVQRVDDKILLTACLHLAGPRYMNGVYKPCVPFPRRAPDGRPGQDKFVSPKRQYPAAIPDSNEEPSTGGKFSSLHLIGAAVASRSTQKIKHHSVLVAITLQSGLGSNGPSEAAGLQSASPARKHGGLQITVCVPSCIPENKAPRPLLDG